MAFAEANDLYITNHMTICSVLRDEHNLRLEISPQIDYKMSSDQVCQFAFK